jgi:hypothetical protein
MLPGQTQLTRILGGKIHGHVACHLHKRSLRGAVGDEIRPRHLVRDGGQIDNGSSMPFSTHTAALFTRMSTFPKNSYGFVRDRARLLFLRNVSTQEMSRAFFCLMSDAVFCPAMVYTSGNNNFRALVSGSSMCAAREIPRQHSRAGIG